MTGTKKFLFVSLILLATLYLVAWSKGVLVISPGPNARIAEAARSLCLHGTLQAPEFLTIRNDALKSSADTHTVVWQDAFAVGKRGELLPKHSLFSILGAALCYKLFGEGGFLVFQFISVTTLLFALSSILASLTPSDTSASLAITLFILTQSIFYFFAFNYDLQGTALLVLGLYLARSFPLTGGLVLGLSVFVRPAYLIFAAPFACAWNLSPLNIRKIALTAAGVAAVLGVFLLVNWQWFGAPFTSAYQHIEYFRDGKPFMAEHPIGFTWDTFAADWEQKLFAPKRGLLLWNPVLLLLPFALPSIFRSPFCSFFSAVLLGAALYFLYIFSYPMWNNTEYGNRFLLPSITLCALPVALWLAELLGKRGDLKPN